MIYVFQHPETGETKEIYQKIDEKHEFTDESGLKWNRVFTTSYISSNVQIDAYSAESYASKTKNKNYTVGEMTDISAELSDKRANKEGIDPVKIEHYDRYAKKNNGVRHVDDKRPADPSLKKKLRLPPQFRGKIEKN